MQRRNYSKEIEDAAELAAKHSLKHLTKAQERWEELGVRNRSDLKKKAIEILKDPKTKGARVQGFGEMYYHEKGNIVIVINREEPEKSTIYRPREDKETIENKLGRSNEIQHDLYHLKPQEMREGGYAGLQEGREDFQKQAEAMTERPLSETELASARALEELEQMRRQLENEASPAIDQGQDWEKSANERALDMIREWQQQEQDRENGLDRSFGGRDDQGREM